MRGGAGSCGRPTPVVRASTRIKTAKPVAAAGRFLIDDMPKRGRTEKLKPDRRISVAGPRTLAIRSIENKEKGRRQANADSCVRLAGKFAAWLLITVARGEACEFGDRRLGFLGYPVRAVV